MGVNKIVGSSISSHDGVAGARLILSLLRTRNLNKMYKETVFRPWATLISEKKIKQDGPTVTLAFLPEVLSARKGIHAEHWLFLS